MDTMPIHILRVYMKKSRRKKCASRVVVRTSILFCVFLLVMSCGVVKSCPCV